jgi:Domain of unknown function (DU1801).
MAERLKNQELDTFLEVFDPAAAQLAKVARALILEVFPDAIEVAEGKEIGYGFDRGYKGLVFAISLKKGGINLGIADGASMADPDDLLRGEGKRHRHVPVSDDAALERPALRQLLKAALLRRRAKSETNRG